MTNDERISAYIDNELTVDQEQELLISLAASETLRKSFRSELVLKKVLRSDERAVNPPRHLRTAVFAAIGIGTAAGVTSEAQAATQATLQNASTQSVSSSAAASAPSHGLLKALFASKVNALLTATGLTVAGIAGYGVHSITNHTTTSPIQTTQQVVVPAAQAPVSSMPIMTEAPAEDQPTATVSAKRTSRKHVADKAIQHASSDDTKPANRVTDVKSTDQTPPSVIGGGTINMEPPQVTRTKK